MPTDNALSATLLWLAAGIAALLLTALVMVAESSRQRGELRRLHLATHGHWLLPGERSRAVVNTPGGTHSGLDLALEPLTAQALAAR